MDEDSRRAKKQWQAQERARAKAAFPLTTEALGRLFEDVDEKLDNDPCDHTLRFTTAWLDSVANATERVLPWLHANGGYCDCEVIANVRDHWEQNRTARSDPRIAVSVALLASPEGGRATSTTMQGATWRPHLRIPPSPELLGIAFTSGPEEVAPGSQCEAVAVLVYTSTGVDYSALQPGVTADIVEGSRVVGTARVVDLLGT